MQDYTQMPALELRDWLDTTEREPDAISQASDSSNEWIAEVTSGPLNF